MYHSKYYSLHYLSFVHFITQRFYHLLRYSKILSKFYYSQIWFKYLFIAFVFHVIKTFIVIISFNDDIIYFKFLNRVTKFNILFFNVEKIDDFEKTILNIFLNVFDENSQLFTKKTQTRNSFNIIIITQLQHCARIDSKRLLDFFIQLRVDKNVDVQCIKDWIKLIRLYEQIKQNFKNTKINFAIALIKKIEFETFETKKFKTTIKQLQIDNIAFQKVFFTKEIIIKKKR